MSQKVISHSPDLKRLRDEGYEIEIKNAHLLVHNVPCVNSKKEITRGTLVSPLDMAGDRTAKPGTHEIHFIGDLPCDKEGNIIQAIHNGSAKKVLAEGIEIDHSFSNKPKEGYKDYYEKVTMYCRIICAEAQAIDPSMRPQTHKVIESNEPDTVFNYFDTNSSRAEIESISMKFWNQRIGIIGLGGTGSYVLDFVAKTPVKEIHIFDEDDFLSHNAFRAPGAPSLETLREQPKKVAYLHEIYSRIHKRITPHESSVTSENIKEILELDFVFVCIDDGEAKKTIIKKLIAKGVPFIDVGMGIYAVDGKLTGSLRATTGTAAKNDHLKERVSFSSAIDHDYDKNVQIAELNALNASLAVIKWKKIIGFYHDFEGEHHSAYTITTNKIINDDILT